MSTPVLPEVAALCALAHPYLPPSHSHAAFHDAMLALTRYHVLRTPGYGRWLAQSGVVPEAFAEHQDWRRLPPIHTRYLKQFLPRSSDPMPTTVLHSSGTSGQKSHLHYDDHSLQALMAMCDRIFDFHGWDARGAGAAPCNYILLSYEPPPASSEGDALDTLGNARTNQFLCKYAPAAQTVYALRATGSGHAFDPHGLIAALQAFAAEDRPVRILGFPAFLWFVLERMRALGLPPLVLHPDSLVLLGGGWKMHAASEIGKSLLYQRLGEQLGIAPQRCRDGYGAVEHGVPYIECARHRFHVPSYARACVRHVRSMQVLDYGEPGLLHLLSPYIMSCPVHSVMPGDLATLWPGEHCGCGLPTDCFVLHGRAGTAAHRNCAVAAAELIN